VAFAWDARVGLPLGIRLRIRDAYDGGTGRGSVRLGPIPLAHEEGSGDLGAAALLRLLAEAPWCPMLLVRRDVLRWRAVGTDRALATLVDHGCTAEIEFRFDEAGDVGSAYSAARPRRTRSGYVATPWEGRFRDYREADGLRIPFAGEVGWYEGSAWACVWRGRVVEARLADEGMPSAATA
jgi:hypothetical protein